MFAHVYKRLFPSNGERSFYVALLGVSFLSAIIAFDVVHRLSIAPGVVPSFSLFDLWTVICGALGGCVAFLLCYERWLGLPGLAGFGRAIYGGVAISFFGSLIGGTFVLPFYGTMFGPFQLIISMINAPLLGVVWMTTLVSSHLLIATWRDERDSIFGTALA